MSIILFNIFMFVALTLPVIMPFHVLLKSYWRYKSFHHYKNEKKHFNIFMHYGNIKILGIRNRQLMEKKLIIDNIIEDLATIYMTLPDDVVPSLMKQLKLKNIT